MIINFFLVLFGLVILIINLITVPLHCYYKYIDRKNRRRHIKLMVKQSENKSRKEQEKHDRHVKERAYNESRRKVVRTERNMTRVTKTC